MGYHRTVDRLSNLKINYVTVLQIFVSITSNLMYDKHQVIRTPLHFVEHISLPVAAFVSPEASDWNPIQLVKHINRQ